MFSAWHKNASGPSPLSLAPLFESTLHCRHLSSPQLPCITKTVINPILLQPKDGHRLINLFLSSANVFSTPQKITHYDSIECLSVVLFTMIRTLVSHCHTAYFWSVRIPVSPLVISTVPYSPPTSCVISRTPTPCFTVEVSSQSFGFTCIT